METDQEKANLDIKQDEKNSPILSHNEETKSELEMGGEDERLRKNGDSQKDTTENKEQQEGGTTEDSLPEVKLLEDVKSLTVEDPDLTLGFVDPAVIELLTSGLVERFLPGLRKSQTTIDQIRCSQDVLLDTVDQEITKFRDCQAVKEVEDTMVKARHYHNKLLRLRREMTNLHEKSRKLKKRALKLQQQKQSEELTRAHTREHELERERMLTARLATSPSSHS
ncbi:biogenesis of lysosome-related organelles complex 1 subunit 6 [Elysia marginata]|uniref:Biogenesis of lysosome-related organelles complex 1 subunit 6 n=1 Tax=Elysia marginata TaxID=1093978 RepID=A0AAV4GY13_9GAST|nr:biogenesis of lysosome-related organelles complex 1 subunit 6 [Elysia marginata]